MSEPRVIYEPIRVEDVPGSDARLEVRVDASVGCRNLEQRLLHVGPGGHAEAHQADSEDVLFVIGGGGALRFGGHVAALEPRSGVVVPADTPYRIDAGPDGVHLLSVLSPQPGRPGSVPAADAPPPDGDPVREGDQEVIAAGDDASIDYMDRWFRVLADPSHGARFVTQFVGYIGHSRAPEHVHTYEEVIYIVDGDGLVHIGETHPLRPGTSIYLPPGAPHCLENPHSNRVLALVGVFCPAGSPKERRPASG
ncbi:MAG TPA: cupin domain-containing protein [Acidimicrobiia bacterium]|nr:cupin domain-containing protein [Acidimicrobiia bacterium]